MRKTICVEGPENEVAGRYLEPGALKWKEGYRYPLTLNFGVSLPDFLGYATDIRREEDGKTITAELVPYPDAKTPIPEKDVSFTCGATGLLGGRTTSAITQADLREVCALEEDRVPW